MKKIYVSDLTLKELAMQNNSALLFREKTAIAACIDKYGADYLELPEVKKPKEDAIIYKTIASILENCGVCIPIGYSESSALEAYNCVKGSKNPVLQIIMPMSTVTMEYTLHMKEEKMLLKIEQLCSYCRSLCNEVEFVCSDAGRADKDFLRKSIEKAIESGASRICLSDDAGVWLPQDISQIIHEVKEYCTVPLFLYVCDDLRMSSAVAYFAIMSGVDGIKVSALSGKTVKAARLAAIMNAKGDEMGVYCSLKATEIRSDIYSLISKVNKIEMIPSTENISDIYDKDCTLADVTNGAQKLGYSLNDADSAAVLKELQIVCSKKSSVGKREFEAIIASCAMQVPSTYHLQSFNCSCNSASASVAHIVLTKNGEACTGLDTGDGPIDAAFKAIEDCVGSRYELDEFQIQALTEGKESLGSVLVKLRNGGKLYSGNGISSDIVGASIRAYINALNKIVYEEAQA